MVSWPWELVTREVGSLPRKKRERFSQISSNRSFTDKDGVEKNITHDRGYSQIHCAGGRWPNYPKKIRNTEENCHITWNILKLTNSQLKFEFEFLTLSESITVLWLFGPQVLEIFCLNINDIKNSNKRSLLLYLKNKLSKIRIAQLFYLKNKKNQT